MNKKILITLLSFSTVMLFSCSDKRDFKTLEDYADVYADIDYDTQLEIEKAYKEKYGFDIVWCMPDDNINEFNTIEDLKAYTESNYGYRVYGEFDGSYVLCLYSDLNFDLEKHTLKYNDTWLIDYDAECFGADYHKSLIYTNKHLFECDNYHENIYDYLDITEKDALEIKANDEKYRQKYFAKFKANSSESYFDAYCRIYSDLLYKEN